MYSGPSVFSNWFIIRISASVSFLPLSWAASTMGPPGKLIGQVASVCDFSLLTLPTAASAFNSASSVCLACACTDGREIRLLDFCPSPSRAFTALAAAPPECEGEQEWALEVTAVEGEPEDVLALEGALRHEVDEELVLEGSALGALAVEREAEEELALAVERWVEELALAASAVEREVEEEFAVGAPTAETEVEALAVKNSAPISLPRRHLTRTGRPPMFFDSIKVNVFGRL